MPRARRRGAARGAGLAVLRRPARAARVRAHASRRSRTATSSRRSSATSRRWRARCATAGSAGELAILRSDGGLSSAEAAVAAPVTMLLSGPAGGVTGAVWVAEQCGYRDLITFDMGGTSTDVALVQGLTPRIGRETKVGDLTVRASSVDVRTVGAGGGSIAHVPELTKALRVGPQSAGADPGPAAYGKGGTEPTVTDANVVLGYLPAVARRRRDHARRRRRPRRGREHRRGRWGWSRRRPRRRGSSTSSTRTCSAACGWSRCSRASTRATSRSSRSAARARCTPTRWAKLTGAWPVIVPPSPGVLCALGDATTSARSESARTVLDRFADLDRRRPEPRSSTSSPTEAGGRLAEQGVPTDQQTTAFQVDVRYHGQGFEIPVDVARRPTCATTRRRLRRRAPAAVLASCSRWTTSS